MTAQIIHISAGAIEYTLPTTIAENTGKDISGDTIRLSLGGTLDPGTDWRAPDVDTSLTPSVRVVQLLIGDTYRPAPGIYYVWWRLGDSPEIIARRSRDGIIVIR